MRFAIAVLILFMVSFGSVFWYQSTSSAPLPVDVAEVLNNEPEEYQRVYAAFRKIGADETTEFDRALVAYDNHQNRSALRQDIGGLVLRAMDGRQQNLKKAGLTWLEKITRKTIGLMRRYENYGENFCSLSIQRDHVNAERVLAENRREDETKKLIEEFKQARFELVVLMLEAVADGGSNPVPVPNVDPGKLSKALIKAASPENAVILEHMKTSEWRCDEAFAVMDSALSIRNANERHAMLAEIKTGL